MLLKTSRVENGLPWDTCPAYRSPVDPHTVLRPVDYKAGDHKPKRVAIMTDFLLLLRLQPSADLDGVKYYLAGSFHCQVSGVPTFSATL